MTSVVSGSGASQCTAMAPPHKLPEDCRMTLPVSRKANGVQLVELFAVVFVVGLETLARMLYISQGEHEGG